MCDAAGQHLSRPLCRRASISRSFASAMVSDLTTMNAHESAPPVRDVDEVRPHRS